MRASGRSGEPDTTPSTRSFICMCAVWNSVFHAKLLQQKHKLTCGVTEPITLAFTSLSSTPAAAATPWADLRWLTKHGFMPDSQVFNGKDKS